MALLAEVGRHEGDKVLYLDKFTGDAAAYVSGVEAESNSRGLVLAPGEDTEYVRAGMYVSETMRAHRWFRSVQSGWTCGVPDGTSLDVSFRFSKSRLGPWTRWFVMPPEMEVSLEESHRFIQFRARLTSETGYRTPRLESISLHFGEARDEEEGLPSGEVVELPAPEIVTREQWGARPHRGDYASHVPNRLVVHHTSSPSAEQYTGSSTIRGIQNYHMDAPSHGWADIGYHFLIGPDGLIYRGRPETVVGAHVIPNANKVGVCLIGDFQPPGADDLTAEQRASLVDLLSFLAGRYGIVPDGIKGHRDYMSTNCPGGRIYELLPELRLEVGDRLGGS